MPRQTPGEIDAEIVDRAAALFSHHGFSHTSLQQVADAVGYTKAGLLHHFPSKRAIYDAVLVAVSRQISELAASAAALPLGHERDRGIVTAMVDLTIAWPGVSEFVSSLVDAGQDLGAEIEHGGLALLGAFGVDLENPDDDRLVRIVSACTGLTVTTLQAVRTGQAREWRELIITAAMNTLGHPSNTPR